MTDELERGPVWRKWDLHVHSPLSLLNNQYPKRPDGTPDWDAYLRRLEETDLRVIGITDYFTIDGYKEVAGFKAKGRLGNITVLPNIEFRLSNVISSKKDSVPRRLNLHVIFSNDIPTQHIEEHFLHDLDFYYEGCPQNPDEKHKLKVSNIADLGKKLKAEHEAFHDSGETEFIVGARSIVVNHEQITDILTNNSKFRGKYLLALPEELSNLIAWNSQDHLIRKALLQKSDLVFTSNRRTISWCLGLGPYQGGPSAFETEFKTLKPCIHGSDAHQLDDIGKPCAKRGTAGHSCASAPAECELRFCWIKADPTFEGLKQLKYEPNDRVKIQTCNPTPLKSSSCIKAFRMDTAVVSSELRLAATNLPLNQSLVSPSGMGETPRLQAK